MKSKTVSAKSTTTRKPRTQAAESGTPAKAPRKTKRGPVRIKINRADPFVEAESFEPTVISPVSSEKVAEAVIDHMLESKLGCDTPEQEAILESVGTQPWAESIAKELFGETAIAWSATHDAGGDLYKAEQFRIGVPTDVTGKVWAKVEDVWYVVEAGKLIMGTGNSYTAAVNQARKRKVAKAAA